MESPAVYSLIFGEPPTIVQAICIAANNLHVEKLGQMMKLCKCVQQDNRETPAS